MPVALETTPMPHTAACPDIFLSCQVEGAFVMGCGMMTQEQVLVDENNGRLLSDSTWTYKIPTAACIPRQLNVEFLKVRSSAAAVHWLFHDVLCHFWSISVRITRHTCIPCCELGPHSIFVLWERSTQCCRLFVTTSLVMLLLSHQPFPAIQCVGCLSPLSILTCPSGSETSLCHLPLSERAQPLWQPRMCTPLHL